MVTKESLQAIIGQAIVDREFREGLLSRPLAMVDGFELSDEEKAVLASIRAKSLEQFAARLDLWLSRLPIGRGTRRIGSSWTSELLRIAG